ncbi:MAG: DUF3592 domain-containing protein [Terriglobales bacterium]
MESLPKELLRCVPRQVALTAAGMAARTVAVLLLFSGVISGAWLYVAAERDAPLRRAVASENVSTMAEVTSLHRRRGDDAKTEVTYRYTANGRDYAGGALLGKRQSATLQQGARIPVLYLASAPALNWLPGREPQGVQFWLVPLVALPLCAIGALILLNLRRQRGLLICGRATLAHVTETSKFGHSHGSGHHVHFEFKLPSGGRRTGSFDVQKQPPEAGSALVIVYDPDHPQRNTRYPLSLVSASLPGIRNQPQVTHGPGQADSHRLGKPRIASRTR